MKKSAGKVIVAALLTAAAIYLGGCSKESKTAAGNSGSGSEKKASAVGKVFNIYCWNTEFKDRFEAYCKDKFPADVKVNWVITPSTDNAYQRKLDEALLRQGKESADKKIDLFLVEADYALKYVDDDCTLDVFNDIGLKPADVAQEYKYTKDVMTDSKGNLKGLSWQATPGGFVYRRSIAKDVLGTDDPDEVGSMLSDWDMFDAVAAKAKEKGYFMLSGFADDFRAFTDNMTQPWVDANGKIQIDPQITKWIEQTKRYTELGYNNKAALWTPESTKGMTKDGKVFGYFGPAWFIDFVMAPNSLEDPNAPRAIGNGSYGDWAFCKGPQSFSWGGTWICGAKGSDNIDLIKDVLYTLCCDEATMTDLAKKYGDFTNNIKAMETVAESDYKNEFLGGQNHIKFFLESATSIDRSTISPYDLGMAEKIQGAMGDYYNELIPLEKAWDNFYKSIIETYPNLSK